jgi:hypothetical protein
MRRAMRNSKTARTRPTSEMKAGELAQREEGTTSRTPKSKGIMVGIRFGVPPKNAPSRRRRRAA